MSKPTFLIVGASLAGAKAAQELRAQGFDGRVMLIGTEPERPYERPPLTKDYLRGESERAKAYVHPDGFYEQQEIELVTGVTVTALEPGASRVTLDDGRPLGYDRLLLATGAEPRRLHIPGADLGGVYYLRTLADCDLHVVAGMNVNVWDVNPHIEALIRARQPVGAGALADPGVRLDSLAGELAAGS
jgi:3-phenylpropionate/trans-cinnamate dioxygenase ferredoxin reductase component